MDELAVATLARLREQLASSYCDVLVLAGAANVAYATGYRSVGGDIFGSHRLAAVVGDEDLILVAPAADWAAATETAVATDRLVPYGRFFFESGDGTHPEVADRHPSFPAALAAALAGLPAAGVIGIDDDVDPAQIPGTLQRVGDWMRMVRRLKSPLEIEHLATAAGLAEAGIEAAVGEAEPGVTERELERVAAATMAAGGGVPRFVVVTSGERSALSDARATDRPLGIGELVRFDVGCTYEGYWSDVGRTVVVGSPKVLQETRYGAILAGVEAQLEAAAPGLAASDLFRIAVDTVEASGLRPFRRHHCGHGIGREVYEPPVVAPGIDLLLEAGMVLCVETPFYELGWGGMMVEETIVITAEGHRPLTHSDRSLRVVGS